MSLSDVDEGTSCCAPHIDDAMATLSARLRAAMKSPDTVSDASMQELMAALVNLYAAKSGNSADLRPFPPKPDVTSDAVMAVTTAMMHAVNLQLFELSLWQTWTGACIPPDHRTRR